MEINYLKLYSNLERVYSFTKAFYCTVRLVSDNPKLKSQINDMYQTLGWEIPDEDEHTDMVVELPQSNYFQIIQAGTPEKGDVTKATIDKAWVMRKKLDGHIDEDYLPPLFLVNEFRDLLRSATDKLNLVPKQVESIIAVARIIAYNDESEDVKLEHLAEAIQYQSV